MAVQTLARLQTVKAENRMGLGFCFNQNWCNITKLLFCHLSVTVLLCFYLNILYFINGFLFSLDHSVTATLLTVQCCVNTWYLIACKWNGRIKFYLWLLLCLQADTLYISVLYSYFFRPETDAICWWVIKFIGMVLQDLQLISLEMVTDYCISAHWKSVTVLLHTFLYIPYWSV